MNYWLIRRQYAVVDTYCYFACPSYSHCLGKVHPFLSFLIVSVIGGLLLGIPLGKITGSIKTGFGAMLGELAVVITLGAMFGKLVAESGAAQSISTAFIHLFGARYLQWGMLIRVS